MPYITLPIMPVFHQLTLMDILRGAVEVKSAPVVWNETNTRTRWVESLDPKFLRQYDFIHMIYLLREFNDKHAALFEQDRASLYDSFKIPKRSGGLRQIDAPCPELMTALRELKVLFETEFSPSRNRCSLYHTSAFAYVRGRSAKDALERHRGNKSNWFLKLDFSNFFGSTTKEFVLHMMTKVFPFSEVMKYASGRAALDRAVDLCFLNGGIPQGTPISPMLTNLIMLPIDYEMGRGLRSLEKPTADRPDGNRFCYTRYADDILISAKRGFSFTEVREILQKVLTHFEAPYICKEEKTHYGSRAGQNWSLGLMLNKDNDITIGWEKKKRLRAMVDSYMTRHENWSLSEIQSMAGQLSYLRQIEPEYFDRAMEYYAKRYGRSVLRRIKDDLRG